MRDDSRLYTGMNSASFAHVVEKKKERRASEQRKAIEFKDDAKAVFKLLDRQIAAIPGQLKNLTVEDSAETWKSTGIALGMYERMCIGLRNDLEKLLGKVNANG